MGKQNPGTPLAKLFRKLLQLIRRGHPCPKCNGTGGTPTRPCRACEGTGRL